MDGAGGVPSVRRPGKGREQERMLEGIKIPTQNLPEAPKADA